MINLQIWKCGQLHVDLYVAGYGYEMCSNFFFDCLSVAGSFDYFEAV